MKIKTIEFIAGALTTWVTQCLLNDLNV